MLVGVGLNKTGTKTLRHHLQSWGYRHQSYDLEKFRQFRVGNIDALLEQMEGFDSFEDWPWPLMYREIDQRFPDAKFVLTLRDSPETWFRSLCKMAVRMGPLNDFEVHIYGHSMPHGHRQQHIQFYEDHNRSVTEYFADRPGKLLTICWEQETDAARLAEFLELENVDVARKKVNTSAPVYGGDNLFLAHLNRMYVQSTWPARKWVRRIRQRLKQS